MTRLTRDDLSVIEGDARVSCRRLAEVLGYNKVQDMHLLIRKYHEELSDFGEVFTFERKNPSAKGGRPIKTYLLNEHQAVAACMWAQTTKAREARMQIVEVFVAWRRGDLYSLEALRQQRGDVLRDAPSKDAFAASADRAADSLRHLRCLNGIDALSREVTHLPIWAKKINRRPMWFHDLEVREFLTVTHRQMSILQAEAEGQKHFGARCPKKSAIGEYWLRLDEAKKIVADRQAEPQALPISRPEQEDR